MMMHLTGAFLSAGFVHPNPEVCLEEHSARNPSYFFCTSSYLMDDFPNFSLTFSWICHNQYVNSSLDPNRIGISFIKILYESLQNLHGNMSPMDVKKVLYLVFVVPTGSPLSLSNEFGSTGNPYAANVMNSHAGLPHELVTNPFLEFPDNYIII